MRKRRPYIFLLIVVVLTAKVTIAQNKIDVVSLSGMASIGVLEFLMRVDKPSPAIIDAVNSALEWLQSSHIEGYQYVDFVDSAKPMYRDRVLQPQGSSTVWARFYNIDTNRPFVGSRNSIKKWDVTEIEHERRVGWYGNWPKELPEKTCPEWKLKNRI